MECEGGLNRRGFLRVVGGAALVAVGSRAAAGGSAASRPLGPAGAAPAVSAARRLYESLTAEQRELLLLPWSDPRRDKVSPNWKIVKATIGQTFSQEQRELVREIVRSVTSEDGFARFSRQMNDDWGGLDNYTCAFFGRPDAGPFQWELTGRHVTLRAGGASAQGRAFGGPIVYGHAPQFNERPGHPGNVFWYQAKRANELFAMLDGRQRRQALLERAPPETAVALRPSATSRPGICVAELSPDQRQLVAQVFEDILAPYCDPARRQAKAILAGGGGLDRLHVAFYKQGDIGNDSIWDIWRLEGPTVVCHFRGAPHIHAYINIGRRS